MTAALRGVATLAISAFLVLVLSGTSDGTTDPEDALVDAVNAARAVNGRNALQVYWDLADDAHEHSASMSSEGEVYDLPELGGVTSNWTLLAQNVAVGESVEGVFNALMSSTSSRANILGPFSYVGVGVVTDGNLVWVTMIFMEGDALFADSLDSIFLNDILWLTEDGSRFACNPPDDDLFCPTAYVDRETMAEFVSKSFHLPPAQADYFIDDEASPYEDSINRVAEAGITFGCNPPANDRFCPDRALNRGEMAAFFVRALGLTDVGTGGYFVDGQDSVFRDDMDKMVVAGITYGCNPPTNNMYCPERVLNRGEIAAFLHRAVGLDDGNPDGGGGGVGGSGLLVWAPRWMSDAAPVSRSEALSDAAGFDVLMAHEQTYRGHVPAMRSANPDVEVLSYVNAVYAEKWLANQGAYPEWWYAHDASGKRVTSTHFGNYIMDPSNSQWWDNRAQKCIDLMADNGYTGCFLDIIGTGPLVPGETSAIPINPATGKEWTESEWLAATSQLGRRVQSRLGGALVVGNGLGYGKRYFKAGAPTSQLFNAVDAMMAEVFVRAAREPVDRYRQESVWKQDVDMLVDAGARGKQVFVITKLWVSATAAQTNAWHKYALATFLLGSDGNSYFSFLTSQDDPTRTFSWWDLDIGVPEGGYYKAGGIYQRNYTRGKVLVNPTGVSRTVTVGSGWVNLNGQSRPSTITLQPHTAEILTQP